MVKRPLEIFNGSSYATWEELNVTKLIKEPSSLVQWSVIKLKSKMNQTLNVSCGYFNNSNKSVYLNYKLNVNKYKISREDKFDGCKNAPYYYIIEKSDKRYYIIEDYSLINQEYNETIMYIFDNSSNNMKDCIWEPCNIVKLIKNNNTNIIVSDPRDKRNENVMFKIVFPVGIVIIVILAILAGIHIKKGFKKKRKKSRPKRKGESVNLSSSFFNTPSYNT
uniref:Ig-like domain-containing protein n=1 Tax=Parastrongyloides trichosuri TaxID=131310 RepID=A0A0N4ZP21_PARTI